MKILLSDPPISSLQIARLYFNHFPGYNLPLLAAMVAGQGHEIAILDNVITMHNPGQLAQAVLKAKPDLVGFSSHFDSSLPLLSKTATHIKKIDPDIPIVIGGHYPSLRWREILSDGIFDFVAVNEGEYVFKNLVSRIGTGAPELEQIRGLAFVKDGVPRLVDPESLISDLDALPFPDRSLLPDYGWFYTPGRSAAVEFARGCIHKCKFCSVPRFKGNSLRKRSVGMIIRELDMLAADGIRDLYIIDDSFGLDIPYYQEILARMVENGYGFKLCIQIRADTVAENAELIRLAARAGLSMVSIGIESYNAKGLGNMHKALKPEQSAKALKLLRKEHVVSWGIHICGIPGEGITDILRTFWHGARNTDLFRMGILTPYYGTQIREELESGNMITGDDPSRLNKISYVVKGSLPSWLVTMLLFILLGLYHLWPGNWLRAILYRDFKARAIRRNYAALHRTMRLYLRERLLKDRA